MSDFKNIMDYIANIIKYFLVKKKKFYAISCYYIF
ncbi:Uncharacterised protein [Moellerella wisconsensis]|nr:Uncharacterised protein [Moellerella wisconsensis]